MDFRVFQSLLEAGMTWEAREKQAALTVSAYPHMAEADQRRVHASFAGAAEPDEVDEVDDKTRSRKRATSGDPEGDRNKQAVRELRRLSKMGAI